MTHMTEDEYDERTIVVKGLVTAEGLIRSVAPEHPLKLLSTREAPHSYDYSELPSPSLNSCASINHAHSSALIHCLLPPPCATI